jgi:hypothetical protein
VFLKGAVECFAEVPHPMDVARLEIDDDLPSHSVSAPAVRWQTSVQFAESRMLK